MLRVRSGGMSVSRRLRPTGGVSRGHPKTAKYTALRREEMAEWSNFREMNDGGGSFYEKMRVCLLVLLPVGDSAEMRARLLQRW